MLTHHLTLALLLGLTLSACGSTEKKPEPEAKAKVQEQRVTLAVLADLRMADELKGSDEESLDWLGNAITAWTTMNGSGKGLQAETLSLGVILGPVFGQASSGHHDDLMAATEVLPTPTLIVLNEDKDALDATKGDALKAKFARFGYSANGKQSVAMDVKTKDKKSLCRAQALPEKLNLGKDQYILFLPRPIPADETFQKGPLLVVGLSDKDKPELVKQGIDILKVPSVRVQGRPFTTITVVKRGAKYSVSVDAWSTELNEQGQAKNLATFKLR